MNVSQMKKNPTCVIQHCRGSHGFNIAFGIKNVNSFYSFVNTLTGARCE